MEVCSRLSTEGSSVLIMHLATEIYAGEALSNTQHGLRHVLNNVGRFGDV